MRPLLERLRDPSHAEADEPSSLGDLCREAADEIERVRRGLFHALIQAGYTPDQMEAEIAACNSAADR